MISSLQDSDSDCAVCVFCPCICVPITSLDRHAPMCCYKIARLPTEPSTYLGT